MDSLPHCEYRPKSRRYGRTWIFCVVLAAAFALVVAAVWKWRSPPAALPAAFTTPFRNIRPEVHYVGDQTCAPCHKEQARTYRRHPMGRSLGLVSASTDTARYAPPSGSSFQKFGSLFLVEHKEGRVVHKEIDRAPDGEVRAQQEAEIAFVVGSGTHGHSYLINHDGYLFYSPISWYAQKQDWDLSPGPARVHHFGRAVTAGCLFCHCNQAEVVADSANHFRPPIFHGHAIGCERCHGPGQLHVAEREAGEEAADVDLTIVNPRHLAPALRDAVCEQCHLQGVSRILRRGRQWFDYRPGLPLSHSLSVFVAAKEGKETDVVGHVEQMHDSVCYQRSAGKMGCVSCHDPHRAPEAAEKTTYYRERCLTCHAETDCAEPLAGRRKVSEADNCIVCHMPRSDSVSVGHVVLTDHRILRRPAAEHVRPPDLRPPDAAALVVSFYRDTEGGNEAEDRRDYALALMESARVGLRGSGEVEVQRRWFSEKALPLLQDAVARHPDDVPAREAKAHALWFLGSLELARLDFEQVLEQAPEREDSLAGAAYVTELLGQTETALDLAERVVRVNPWSWRHHYQLAGLLAKQRQWPRAAAESKKGLTLNPWSGDLRSLRIRCLLAAGERQEAEAELRRLLPMVADPEVARRWFEEQAR
jgi:hypothetical protein